MGILLCEQNFRDVWSRNESVRAEIGQILHTDTLTHAAKLVVRVKMQIQGFAVRGQSYTVYIREIHRLRRADVQYTSPHTMLFTIRGLST